jgi:hypothetical protein
MRFKILVACFIFIFSSVLLLSSIFPQPTPQRRNYLLYFICSDDKLKPNKSFSLHTPDFGGLGHFWLGNLYYNIE